MSEPVIRFGPAGMGDSFAAQGYKTSLDIPAYTAAMGLNAFEYQCGHGVRLAEDKARKMAALAAEKGMVFSVHAKRLGSIRYLLQSCALCRALGGRRVIFHPGSCGKQSREAALEKALDTLRRAMEALDEAGYGDMTLCPETLGKIGQLGDLEEVLALCQVDKRLAKRTMPPFSTGWVRRWAMTGRGSSMSTFPGLNFPPAAKSATGLLPRPSTAPSRRPCWS